MARSLCPWPLPRCSQRHPVYQLDPPLVPSSRKRYLTSLVALTRVLVPYSALASQSTKQSSSKLSTQLHNPLQHENFQHFAPPTHATSLRFLRFPMECVLVHVLIVLHFLKRSRRVLAVLHRDIRGCNEARSLCFRALEQDGQAVRLPALYSSFCFAKECLSLTSWLRKLESTASGLHYFAMLVKQVRSICSFAAVQINTQ